MITLFLHNIQIFMLQPKVYKLIGQLDPYRAKNAHARTEVVSKQCLLYSQKSPTVQAYNQREICWDMFFQIDIILTLGFKHYQKLSNKKYLLQIQRIGPIFFSIFSNDSLGNNNKTLSSSPDAIINSQLLTASCLSLHGHQLMN